MESIKAVFFKPDPAAQKRKCDALIRSNTTALDRQILATQRSKKRSSDLVKQALKDGSKAEGSVRVFAKEYAVAKKTEARLSTSRAQLQSVKMQIAEAFAMRKIESGLQASTIIMKNVNSMVRLKEMNVAMQQMSKELMTAGVIDEMVGDTLPSDEIVDFEKDATEDEVNVAIDEILNPKQLTKPAAVEKRPAQRLPQQPVQAVEEEETEQEDMAPSLADMRGRLEALKS